MAQGSEQQEAADQHASPVQVQQTVRRRPHPLSRTHGRQDHVRAVSGGKILVLSRLVDRFGRTGTAALTSLIWALPMAAWAGSSDLSPIDRTAYPGVALSAGIVMLVVWLILLTRRGRIPVPPRQRRLDFAQMSRSE